MALFEYRARRPQETGLEPEIIQERVAVAVRFPTVCYRNLALFLTLPTVVE